MEKVSNGTSEFTGGFWGMLGTLILCDLITIFTLTIGTPWAIVKFIRWKTKHTWYNGKQLTFNGTGGKLFGKILLWLLLTVVTIGIFSLFIPVKFMRWRVENTSYPLPQQDRPVIKPSPVSANTTATTVAKPSAPVVQVSVGNGTPSSTASRPLTTSTVSRPVTTAPVQSASNLTSATPPTQKTFSPLTHAPVPKSAEPTVTPNRKAGIAFAIFALVFAIISQVIFSVATEFYAVPEMLESLLDQFNLNINVEVTYFFYASAVFAVLGFIFSIVGMCKFKKEKTRSGAKPVATLVFSIIALLWCIGLIVFSLSYEYLVAMLADFLESIM